MIVMTTQYHRDKTVDYSWAFAFTHSDFVRQLSEG